MLGAMVDLLTLVYLLVMLAGTIWFYWHDDIKKWWANKQEIDKLNRMWGIE